MAKHKKTPPEWLEAQKRSRLSAAHLQMARELGMNPRKLGKLANHKQEPWKMPLPAFIEDLYERRFKRSRPLTVPAIKPVAINSPPGNSPASQPAPPAPKKDPLDDVPF